eukprot:14369769-Alexandrium_andersonii.AAC.1
MTCAGMRESTQQARTQQDTLTVEAACCRTASGPSPQVMHLSLGQEEPSLQGHVARAKLALQKGPVEHAGKEGSQ